MKKKWSVKLSPRQREIIDFDAQNEPWMTILEGAVRSGKTFLNNILWLSHVKKFSHQRKKFIITGNTLGSLKRNILDDLQTQFGVDTGLSAKNEFTLFGNTMVCFGSSDSRASRTIKGFTSYGWYGNEISESDPEAVKQALARCSGKGARIFWDTNPAGPNHFIKTGYIDRDGQTFSDGRIAIKSWHFTLSDNPFLDASYIEAVRAGLPQDSVWYRRNIEGLWVQAGNVIYSHYRIENFEIAERFSSFDECIAGLDFGRGGNSPSAFVLIGRQGEGFTVIDEVYQAGCLNAEFIRLVDDRLKTIDPALKRTLTVYGDSADPDKLMEWQRTGFSILGADKSPHSVVAGIEAVMSHPLTIRSGCRNTVSEIQSYEWKTDLSGDPTLEPVKFNDHCMDALRYAIYNHTRRRPNGGAPKGRMSVGRREREV